MNNLIYNKKRKLPKIIVFFVDQGSQFSLSSNPLSLLRLLGCLRISMASLIRRLKR
jgi:hypothetical protein